MPKVSVIMPVYNGERFLAEAIESVLQQTFEDFELICVNDGSTDRSQDIIDGFSDPRLICLYQENSGQASARNHGVEFSKGDLICFLDQDDIYLPFCLEERIKYLQKNPEISFAYNDSMIIDENCTVISSSIFKWKNLQPVSGLCFNKLFLNGTFITPSAIIIKKGLIKEVDMFDEELWGVDDYDLWLRIAHKNYIGFISLPLTKYRLHSQNLSKDVFFMEERTARTLLKAAENVPDIEKIIGKSAMRKRLHQVCFDVAYQALTAGDLDTGRYWLKKAWQWGRRPKSLFLLVAGTCFGPLVRKHYSGKKAQSIS